MVSSAASSGGDDDDDGSIGGKCGGGDAAGVGVDGGRPPPPLSLPSFLSGCTAELLSPSSSVRSEPTPSSRARPRRRYRVALGNEAGDADSIVAALVYGYVLRLEDEIERAAAADDEAGDGCGGGGAAAANDETFHVPLVGISRADLPLRRETTLLLDLAGIDLGSVLCVDDPAVGPLLSPTDSSNDDCSSHDGNGVVLEVTLLDHNRIRSSLSHLDANVVEILDHHEDERCHAGTAVGSRRVVAFEDGEALVGSACTLVAERLLRALDEAVGGGRWTVIDPSVGLCLLGVILLDTMNMSPAAGKGTDRDGAAIRALIDRTDWSKLDLSRMDEATRDAIFPPPASEEGGARRSTAAPDREALHDLLRNSKFDPTFWSGLSAWDCLRIDYKRFEPSRSSNLVPVPVPFGMSSVLLPLSDLTSKDGFADSVGRYLSPRELGGVDVPLLAVLTMTLKDGSIPHREMLLAGRADLVDAAADYLLHDESAAFLQVTEAEEEDVASTAGSREGGGVKMRRFRQGNSKGSRKQVAPVLLKLASMLQL